MVSRRRYRRFRKSYAKRYYGRYRRRRARYPRTTRARAFKAYRWSRKNARSLSRLRRKFDFQRYYNWNDHNYIIDFLSNSIPENEVTGVVDTSQGTLIYTANSRFLTSSNIVPFWIRGTTLGTGTDLSFSPLALRTMNQGVKPGTALTSSNYPAVQGGRMRVKNLYCRWNFRYVDQIRNTTGNDEINHIEGTYNSIKVRLCVFTLNDQNTSHEYVNGINSLGDLTYTPIGLTNNNAYFDQNYFIWNLNSALSTTKYRSPIMAMKNVGSTRLNKVYDRTFTLNRLKTTKTVKLNLYKGSIFRFDSDYVPTDLVENGTLYMWPFQQVYFCVMVENSWYQLMDATNNEVKYYPQGGKLMVENQNVVIYYDT